MKCFNVLQKPVLLLLMLLGCISTHAQYATPIAYPFTASSKPFNYLVGGSPVGSTTLGTGILTDDGVVTGIPIGFTFRYCNVNYTQLSAAANCYLSLANSSTAQWTNSQANMSGITPMLMPFWDDMYGNSSGAAVTYLTSGAAGSRVFTIEWKNWRPLASTGNPEMTIQVKLYEGANAIEFLYKQESGTYSSYTATIGMGGTTNADYAVLNNSGTTPTPSATTFTNGISSRPATGQSYLWGLLKKGFNNASAASVASPTGTFCAGVTLPVSVVIKNNGFNQINNLKIYWSLDGGTPTLINWNTLIDTLGSVPGNAATVNLGNIFFGAAPHNFKVYTSVPNGIVDTVNVDDTLNFDIGAALNGVYYVGGPSPDFATVQDAADAVVKWGVCGPVTFKIRSGTYIGRINLGTISGGSAVNRVSFIADDGVPASSININYASAGTGDNSVINFSGASYVTLKNLTINNTTNGAGGVGSVVFFAASSPGDSILGCTMNTLATVQSSSYACIASTSTGYNLNGLTIMNNTLNGSAGIYYLWGTSGSPISDFVCSNNTINAYYMGIYYLYYFNGPVITNNTINGTSSFANYGIYEVYGNVTTTKPMVIANNRIRGFVTYGLLVEYPKGTSATNRAKIMNNVILNTAPNSYGLMVYYPANTDMLNNTVVISGGTSSSTSYAAGYFTQIGDNNRIMNNLFVNYTGSPAYSPNFNTSFTNNEVDYNTYYTTGSVFAYDIWNGVNLAANMSAWRASSYSAPNKADRNSIFYDPGINPITGVPDPSNPGAWAINGRGKQVLGNNTDFTGAARPDVLANGVPDVGAYELEPTSIPPSAIPNGPAVVGGKQYFLFGGDTVASVTWNPALGITDSLDVKVYSGRKAPGFNLVSPTKFMYFYTDIKPRSAVTTFDFNTEVYYKDPWLGTMPTEANVKMAEKVGPVWVAYNGTASAANTTRNFISAPGLASFGYFTGIDDGTIFSAIVKATSSTVICNGSRVVLKANTGTGYTYQWNKNGAAIPGATQDSLIVLQAGDYSVTVTSPLGTATSISITVSTIAPPMAQIAASGALTYCPGSNLTLTANTGAGLTYQWQLGGLDITGATGTAYAVNGAGTYTVKVKNLGCSSTSNATVVSSGPLSIALGNDTAFCESKFIPYVLDAGVPGARYQWSTGDTTQKINVYKTSGNYWVVVNAGPNCIDADTIHLAINPLPSVNAINALPIGTNTWSFTPAGGQNINNILWIFPDGTTSNQNTVQHTFPDGNVVVRLVMYNDCGTDTTLLIRWVTNVNTVTGDGFDVKLYPNPANEKVTLSLDGNVYLKDVTILNSVGAVIYRQQVDGNAKEVMIDMTPYASGQYIIRAGTSAGAVTKPLNIIR